MRTLAGIFLSLGIALAQPPPYLTHVQGTVTPGPSFNGSVVVTCPSVVTPDGSNHTASKDTPIIVNGHIDVSVFPTDFAVSQGALCGVVYLQGASVVGRYNWVIPAAYAGTTVSPGTIEKVYSAPATLGSNTFTGTQSIGTTVLPGGVPINIKAPMFNGGAKGDARSVSDAAITGGTATLTSATAAFTSADTGKLVAVSMGPQAVVTGTYTSGITATGTNGQSCVLTMSNGGGSGATATVYLTATNTIPASAIIFFTPSTFGTGYTSAPTTATASNGTATCSGTATVSTQIYPLPVLTTATYVNATTITLGVNATTGVSSARMTISTDDTAAIQAAINAAINGTLYVPSGIYGHQGLTIAGKLKIVGDGVGVAGSQEVPNTAPYLKGSVLNMMKANADAVLISVQDNISLYDFGIRFDPTIAFWQTGHGFNATASGIGVIGAEWNNLKVWGVDGNHYAYFLNSSVEWNSHDLMGFGGGGLKIFGQVSGAGNSVISGAYFAAVTGGTGDCYNVSGSSSANFENLLTYIRPQCNIDPWALVSTWFPLPVYNYSAQNFFNADDNQKSILVIEGDFEGNGGSNPSYTGVYNAIFPNNDSFLNLGLSGGDVRGVRAGGATMSSQGWGALGRPSVGTWCAGAEYRSASLYALAANASCISAYDGNLVFYTDTGLTPGATYSSTERGRFLGAAASNGPVGALQLKVPPQITAAGYTTYGSILSHDANGNFITNPNLTIVNGVITMAYSTAKVNASATDLHLASTSGSVITDNNTQIKGGTTIVYRCSVAGAARAGTLTTVSADCGTAVDTGLRVN